MSDLTSSNSSNNSNKVLLNINKRKTTPLSTIIVIACVIGAAIGLLGVNFWHAFSCSGNEGHDGGILALMHRLEQVEAKAAYTTKATTKLIQKLEKKLLDIDPATMEDLEMQSRSEAVRLALAMADHPPPPMPIFSVEDKEFSGDYTNEFAKDDYFELERNITEFIDDPYVSELKKDDFQKELKQLEEVGSAPLLTDSQAEQECIGWKTKYSVVPGASWGTLPSELQQKWLEYSCDYFLLEKL